MREVELGTRVRLLRDDRPGVMAPPRDLVGAVGTVQGFGKVCGERTFHVLVSRHYDEHRFAEVDECCIRLEE